MNISTIAQRMSCPFLNKFPSSFVKHYSNTLIGNYAYKCPFMSRRLSSFASDDQDQSQQKQLKQHPRHQFHQQSHQTSPVADSNANSLSKNVVDENFPQCPFIDIVKPSLKVASANIVQDIYEVKSNKRDGFPYDKFFLEQIMKKKKEHSYRVFKKVARDAKNFPFADELSQGRKEIKVWCSNDYMGITTHPGVKKAIIDAVEEFGSGSGGTRNISGNTPFHTELEEEIAKLHQKEAALLFTSCFVANDSTLFTLAKLLPGCHIFSDAGNHASMIQGIRNSGVPKHIFRTCDPDHLESLLKTVDISLPKIVAFETVHSMTGDIGPVEKLCDVANKYNAITFVDEVHAVGLYGRHGAGIAERDGVSHKVNIFSGTLGKAYGNIGGYIAGSSALVDMIRSYAAGFIFTTSLPPTVLSGALASIRILKGKEGVRLREVHQEKVDYFKRRLKDEGIPQMKSKSHIIPVPIGSPWLSQWISNELLNRYGHYVQAINYPTVSKGQERLRIAPSPLHTFEMIDEFIADFVTVWKRSGLPLNQSEMHPNETCRHCHQPWDIDIDSFPCGPRSDCPLYAPC